MYVAVFTVLAAWCVVVSHGVELENLMKSNGVACQESPLDAGNASFYIVHPMDAGNTSELSLKERLDAAFQAVNGTLMLQFGEHMRDPFLPGLDVRLSSALQAARTVLENTLLAQLRKLNIDSSTWPWVEAVIAAKLDTFTDGIQNRVEIRKREILNWERKVYEIARLKQLNVRQGIGLNGNGTAVDQAVLLYMRRALAAFLNTALLTDVMPSPSFSKLVDRLKENSLIHWRGAHDANRAHHLRQRLILRSAPIASVDVEIRQYTQQCPNEHIEYRFNLSERLPEYFEAAVRDDLLTVNVTFYGSGGGSGALNLDPNVGNQLVSTGGMQGKKHLGNAVYYNAASTVLLVVLDGGGWKHGFGYCNNRLWMEKITMTITRNQLALSDNIVYKQEYAEPVF